MVLHSAMPVSFATALPETKEKQKNGPLLIGFNDISLITTLCPLISINLIINADFECTLKCTLPNPVDRTSADIAKNHCHGLILFKCQMGIID